MHDRHAARRGHRQQEPGHARHPRHRRRPSRVDHRGPRQRGRARRYHRDRPAAGPAVRERLRRSAFRSSRERRGAVRARRWLRARLGWAGAVRRRRHRRLRRLAASGHAPRLRRERLRDGAAVLRDARCVQHARRRADRRAAQRQRAGGGAARAAVPVQLLRRAAEPGVGRDRWLSHVRAEGARRADHRRRLSNGARQHRQLPRARRARVLGRAPHRRDRRLLRDQRRVSQSPVLGHVGTGVLRGRLDRVRCAGPGRAHVRDRARGDHRQGLHRLPRHDRDGELREPGAGPVRHDRDHRWRTRQHVRGQRVRFRWQMQRRHAMRLHPGVRAERAVAAAHRGADPQ